MKLVFTSSVAKRTFGSVEMAPNRRHNFYLSSSWGNHHRCRSRSNHDCKHDRDWDIVTDQRSPKKAKINKDVCDLDEGTEVVRDKSILDLKIESEIAEENEVTVAVLSPYILKSGNEKKAVVDSNQKSSKKEKRKSDKFNKKAVCDPAEGIKALRENLMLEIKTVAENIKTEVFKQGVDSEIAENKAAAVEMARTEKQFNTRTRRTAACKELNAKRAEFSLVLSKKKIDEDFWELVGRKPPRYPKKRPKTIQNDLDKCFPGLISRKRDVI